MYTSKSLLDSITVGKLEFDCTNIVAWLHANKDRIPFGLNLPIESVARTAGVVTKLSGGCFGAVFKLSNYPGLILKVCLRSDDAYPDYIRSVAVKHSPKWAPKIFAHGGDETKEGFWCVMPAYEETARLVNKWGREIYPSEAENLAFSAGRYMEARYKGNEFARTSRRQITELMLPLWHAGADADMHMGNIMLDPATGHYVITDPVGYMPPEAKAAFRANR